MVEFIDFIRSFAAEQPAVFDLLWQSTVALALGIVGARLCARRPSLAHAILVSSLTVAVLAPIASLCVRALGMGFFSPPSPTMAAAEFPLNETTRSVSATSSSAWIGALFLCIWICMSIVLLVRLARSVVASVRIRRDAVALESDAIAARALTDVAKEFSLQCIPVAARHDRVKSPIVWCWGRRPVVVLPATMFDGAMDRGLSDVLRHELAHCARRDHIWSMLAAIAVCVLPWHPLVWVVNSRIREEAELACDLRAVESGAEPVRLASMLVGLCAQRVSPLTPGARGSGRRMMRRVEQLLSGRSNGSRLSRGMVILVVGGACGFIAATSMAHRRAVESSAEPLVIDLDGARAPDQASDGASEDGIPFRTSVSLAALSEGAGLHVMPSDLDLGAVDRGTVASGSVWLINRDTIPISLSAIRTSCGCTAAHGFRAGVLEPGEAMQIEVTLEAPDRDASSVERTVTVLADDFEPLEFPVRVRTTG